MFPLSRKAKLGLIGGILVGTTLGGQSWAMVFGLVGVAGGPVGVALCMIFKFFWDLFELGG